jgi:hypothetical protein
MLRITRSFGGRAKGYFNRVMHYPHRRVTPRWLGNNNVEKHNPINWKQIEEYKDTTVQRTGAEWYHRMKRRLKYRHWPWATWRDDPVRRHKEPSSRRSFSMRNMREEAGSPLWDWYALVGQDYGIPDSAKVTVLAQFIHTYTNKTWSMQQLQRYLEKVEREWPTVADAHRCLTDIQQWCTRTNALPSGLLQHLSMLIRDVVLLNRKKAHRQRNHESGVLRTNTMERYFALPYTRGPAMPVELQQADGVYPCGKWLTMDNSCVVHPEFRLDGKIKNFMLP